MQQCSDLILKGPEPMKLMTRLVLALAGVLGGSLAAPAQDAYPARPITIMVPFAAGGPVDVMARIAGEHMSRTLGQNVVVENVTGAGGTVGVRRAASAAPDGYTLSVGNPGSHAAAFSIYGARAGYDPRDLEPIGLISSTPMYLVVRRDFPAKTLAEFVAYAKANPGQVKNAHGGVGGITHLTCALLASVTGIELTFVPYRGSAPAMNDLVAGQIDSLCDSTVSALPQIAADTVRALVVAEEKRIPFSPEVPASPEAGEPKFLATSWNAMFAPKGTPRPIVIKLEAVLKAALADPGVQKRIADLGGTLPESGQGADWMKGFIRAEIDKWGSVVRAANVQPQ
jgi:tripartite-type tricarboxylate transporter receptor subunit TctC